MVAIITSIAKLTTTVVRETTILITRRVEEGKEGQTRTQVQRTLQLGNGKLVQNSRK